MALFNRIKIPWFATAITRSETRTVRSGLHSLGRIILPSLKFLGGLTLALLAFVLTVCADDNWNGGNPVVFHSQTFVRTKGSPNSYTTTFKVPGWVVAPFNMHVVNGDDDGRERVSSATVLLNGTQVLGPSDLNQTVGALDLPVSPALGLNTLQVTLDGKPGSEITITIWGTNADEVPPQVTIVTPANGSYINTATPRIEVTYSKTLGFDDDRHSDCDETTLKITLDGIDRTKLFTIRKGDATATIPTSLALTPGLHTLVATLYNEARIEGSATSQFTVVLNAPTIQIVQPTLGAYLNTTTPTITIQYSASGGVNLSTLKVLINGTDQTALFTKTNTSATAILPAANALPQGANQIVAQIQDLAGNQASASTSFNVDTTPPTISVSHPAANSYFGSSTVAIAVQYSDDQAIDTTQLKVTIDGTALAMTALPASATGTVSGLANGAHLLVATIKDLAGNAASAQITFYVDTTIPTIHISQPAANALLSTHTPQVMIDYTDVGGVDLTTLKVLVNGVDATSLFNITSASATAQLTSAFALPDGQNTITAQIANLAGTVGTATSTFLVDTTPPTIAFQAPPAKTNSNTPTVTIVYSDATSGVDPNTLVVTLDGADISTLVAPGASSATGILQLSPPLADGTHSLTASVKDRAGNQSSPATLSFIIDTTPPTVSFTAPLDNSFINNPTPAITLQYSDTGVGVDTTSVKVFLQQGTNPPTDITAYLQIGPQQATGAVPNTASLTDGTYVLNATVSDLVGNVGNARATFVLDTVPPTGTIQAPAANAILNTASVPVTLLYQDDRSGVDTSKLILTVDGVNQTSVLTLSLTQATGTLPPLPDGVHTIQLTVFDRSGNSSGVISQTFETDTTPPTIVVSLSPTPNAAGWNNTSVTVTSVCGDVTSGVATCPASQVVTTEGANQVLTLTATDNAGNTTTTSVTLNIAKTLPQITASAAPAPNSSGWNNSSVTVSFTCTLTVAPIATCPPPQTVSTEGAGQIISGTAMDAAGNSAIATATVNLDKTPPAVAVTSPSANAVLNSQSVSVSGTVADSLSGVAGVSCNGTAGVVSAGSFSCTLSLSTGPNNIVVQATDAAGNSATATVAVMVQLSAPPTALVFTMQPPALVQTGQLLLPGPQVAVEDASGAVLTSYNGPVMISINNNPGRATLGGTLTQNAVSGVATFLDLSLNTAGNGYTLLASTAGLSATSAPFNVRVSPALASCVPTGSLSVLLPASGTGNVTAYVPNGSWSDGHAGIQVVPIEGGGSPAVISTPNPVNSCASNSVTGETVCVANTADVYLLSGATLNSTLTSASTGVTVQFDPPVGNYARPPKTPFLSGGWCLNCGVAINAVTNTAAIEMGLTTGLPPFYSGLQFLDLTTNTFSAPLPLANDITEEMEWDSIRNLILLPSEYDYPTLSGPLPFFGLTGGNYDLIDTSKGTPTEFGNFLWSADMDSAAEDCTTGIALAGIEGTLPPPAQYPANLGLFISDLSQAAFTTGSPGTWSAPGQFVGFPEFLYINYATLAGTSSVAVPPGSHLAVVTSEGAGNGLAVVELPSTSGSGTPGFGDYAAAALPPTPDGQAWSQGFDPHTITAYVSPNTGRPMAIFANTSPPNWLAVIDLQGLLDAPRKAGVLPNNLGIPCPTCTHTVDPSYDLLASGVVRYIGTPPQIALACPSKGLRGQQHQQVNLNGNQTHWTQGTPTASFGPGITVESLTVYSATYATAVISIDPAADLGPRTVTMTTGSEVATVDNPYMITALAPVSPSTGQQGQQNLSVTLTGLFTNWVSGEPRGGLMQVSFGPGISVASLTVNSPTSMTAVLNIDPSAPIGTRPVTITNIIACSDTQTFSSAFTVTAGALILESVNPNSGQQDQQNLSVTLTGSGTNWVQGTTTASFGPWITVASLIVNSPTSAMAVLNINANATVGPQTVTVTTGSEVETSANGFFVTSASTPLLLIEPNTGQQGRQNLSVLISDDFISYWVPGLTTASFGPGITVTSVTVNATYAATAVLNIDPAAAIGPRTVTLTTGNQIDTQSNGFTVTAGAIGPPTQLSFTVEPPSAAKTFQAFTTQVSIEDNNGSVVTSFNGPVTISLGNNPGGATIAGTTTQNAVNGVASFLLNLNTAGNGYTLAASGNGFTAISSPFNVTVSSQLAACTPAGSLAVLTQGNNVSSYVPNGNWETGITGVELVPVEGSGPRADITTPNVVNSCASNSVTGETVCTANTSDVYLINGSTLTSTLQSAGYFNNVPGGYLFSGGDCSNCGVGINPTTNQAIIAMGLNPATLNYSTMTGMQLLDLNTNTFAQPIPDASPYGGLISEDIAVDPIRNLVLSAGETGSFDMFNLGTGATFYNNDSTINKCLTNCSAGDNYDATAVDCTTGIAVASHENSGDISVVDPTQATFGSYFGTLETWTAPGQVVQMPEVSGNGTPPLATRGAIAIAPGSHLGVSTGEFGGNSFNVFQLPATSGTGVPGILDYVAGSIPADPSGAAWSYGRDPHSLTAYSSPTNNKPYGLVANLLNENIATADTRPSYLAVLDLQGLLNAPRSAAHIIDPTIDLVGTGLIRFVPVYAPTTQLVFVSQPANGIAGQPLSQPVQVAFEDAQGNIDKAATGQITLTASNGAVVVPNTATAVDGVATFSNPAVFVSQPGTYTLTASSLGLPNASSAPFVIAANPAAQLIFTTQPASTAIAGQALPAVQVAVLDGAGNPVTTATYQVTVTVITGSQGNGSPIGVNQVQSTVNGVATFSGLTVGTSGVYQLLASSSVTVSNTLSAYSSAFQILNPYQLAFLVQPINLVAGGKMNPVQVAAVDNSGNVVVGASGTVTIALLQNPSGGTLSGITSAAIVNGIATFSGLSIDKAGNGYSLVASGAGFFSVNSNLFNVVSFTGPGIVSINPSLASLGQSLQVTITAQNTHFLQGTTTANFGPGVSVGSGISGGFAVVQVTSPTTAIAQVNVAANAAPGLRTVLVLTGSEQASLVNGFAVNGTPYLSYVSPSFGQPGQTVPVTIKGVFTNFQQGITQATFGAGISVGGAPEGGPGPVSITDASTATAQLTINAAATPGLRPVTLQTGAEQDALQSGFLVLSSVTGAPPIVSIDSPTEGAEITSPSLVTGTVTSPNLATWTLDYQGSDSTIFTTFATGTSATVSGTFDPTLLLNGLAVIRLTAVDQSGQTSSTTVNVAVARKLKVGVFTVSFNDLTIPVAGIPIQITRTYDSRFKAVGDFGFGWTLSIKSMKVSVNGMLGMNWQGDTEGSPLVPVYCITPAQNHIVTIRLPGDTLYQFQPVLTAGQVDFAGDTRNGCQFLQPLQTVDVSFVPVGATPANATLTAVNGTALFLSGTIPGIGNPAAPIQLVDSVTGNAFDPDQFQLTMPTGQTFLVSRTFGVQSVIDTNNNTLTITSAGITSSTGKGITFARDSQNRITTITDPKGNALTYAYDGNGDLATFTDQLNNVSTFTYDSAHNLLSYTDPRGIQPLRNIYDDSGRLIEQIGPSGNVQDFNHLTATNTEAWTDFLGNTTTYVYDNHGNIIQETDPLGDVTSRTFDANDNMLSETNALGLTSSYTYDASNNVLTQTDPLGNTAKYTYNSLNRPLTITDPNGHTQTFSYDANGNLLTMTDSMGNTTKKVYSGGLQISSTDPLGHITNYVYDAYGNLSSTTNTAGTATAYTYDYNGNRTSQSVTRTTSTGLQTLKTQYVFNAANNLIGTTFPDGSMVQKSYDPAGKLSSAVDELGRTTSYQYDSEGHLTVTTYPDGSQAQSTYDADGNCIQFTGPSGATLSFNYDALGRVTTTTNNAGGSTNTVYDAAGRTLSVTDPRGNVTQYTYDAAGRRTSILNALQQVTSFVFDAAGNQVSGTDANGHATTILRDNDNRVVKVTYPDGTFDQRAYDVAGQMVSKTDAAGNATQYGFDSLGRLVSVTDALGNITKFAYDEVGNRISETDANGNTINFQYDQRGRRTARTLPAGQTESFAYDAAGNVVSHTDFNGKTTTYTHDLWNRLLSKVPDPSFNAPTVTFTYNASGQRASMTDASGTSTYQYDSADRLVQVVKPNGTLSYTYDSANNLLSLNGGGVQVNYTYDPLNRLATVSETGTGTTSYNYDGVGNLTAVAYPNGVNSTYVYDTKNELSSLLVGKGGSNFAGYAYTMDASGHRLTVAELNGRMVHYSYDPIYRLTSESVSGTPVGPNGNVSYTYDAVGNRTQRMSTLAGISSVASGYDADDRLTSRDIYDANGNTISIFSSGIANNYDFENRLIQHGGVTIVYDGDGNRVQKTVGGLSTKYLVDDHNPTGLPQVISETSSDGSSRTFVYGLERISQRGVVPNSNPVTSFYIYDGHGSVRELTDPTGALTDTYDYDAFGNLINSTGSTPNEFLFAGEQFDSDLGLYYNRARYFDPTSGRFWTADALEGNAQSPLSLHRYLYSNGDPVNRVDPTGNQTLGEEMESIAIDSILSEMASSVLSSPLGRSASAIVASALLPPGFFDTLLADAQTPGPGDPLIFGLGVNIGGSVPVKGGVTVGAEFEGGEEVLWSPMKGSLAGYLAFNMGVTVGLGHKPGVEGGASVYGGYVFNAATSEEYGHTAIIISFSATILQTKVVNTMSNYYQIAANEFLRFPGLLPGPFHWASVIDQARKIATIVPRGLATGHLNVFWEGHFPDEAYGFTLQLGTFSENVFKIGVGWAEQWYPRENAIVDF